MLFTVLVMVTSTTHRVSMVASTRRLELVSTTEQQQEQEEEELGNEGISTRGRQLYTTTHPLKCHQGKSAHLNKMVMIVIKIVIEIVIKIVIIRPGLSPTPGFATMPSHHQQHHQQQSSGAGPALALFPGLVASLSSSSLSSSSSSLSSLSS